MCVLNSIWFCQFFILLEKKSKCDVVLTFKYYSVFYFLKWSCHLSKSCNRSTQWTIFGRVCKMTYFVTKRFHLQLKLVKYYSFKGKLYSLLASQESPKIVASKTLPAKIDTLQCFMTIWKIIEINIFACFSPNLLKTELISCNNCIGCTLFLDIKQKGNVYINFILRKCQQGRYPSRMDIWPNKSLIAHVLYTSVDQAYQLMNISKLLSKLGFVSIVLLKNVLGISFNFGESLLRFYHCPSSIHSGTITCWLAPIEFSYWEFLF